MREIANGYFVDDKIYVLSYITLVDNLQKFKGNIQKQMELICAYMVEVVKDRDGKPAYKLPEEVGLEEFNGFQQYLASLGFSKDAVEKKS